MYQVTPEDFRRDIYSQLQTMPGTAVCWRRGDEQLGVFPQDEALFKLALRTTSFAFAIKVRVPAIQVILNHKDHSRFTAFPLGVGSVVPVITSLLDANLACLSTNAAIIRDEQAIVVWTQRRVQDLLTEFRILEHRLNHLGGFCECYDLSDLPADMLPVMTNSTSQGLDTLLEVSWPGAANTGAIMGGQDSLPFSTSSSLPSLSELPSLYGFAGGDNFFELSMFDRWNNNDYAILHGPGSLWDDEVVERNAFKKPPSNTSDMGPPAVPLRFPRPARSVSPISSPSSVSASSASPPPSSSCASSTLPTPQTVCLSDISPAPLPAPPLVDTDSEMSDAEGETDDGEASVASYRSPSSSPEMPLATLVARRTPARARPAGSVCTNALGLSGTRQWHRALLAPVASSSTAAGPSTSRKRKSPSPSPPARRPPARPSASATTPSPARRATRLSGSPLSDMSELSDADAEYDADGGSDGDDETDDEYVEARRPVKRARTASGGSKTTRTSGRAPPPPPQPRRPEPADDEADDGAEDACQPGKARKRVRRSRVPKKWSCDLCRKKFTRYADVDRHKSTACTGVLEEERTHFECTGLGLGGCGKSFNRDDALNRHMRTCSEVSAQVKARLGANSQRL